MYEGPEEDVHRFGKLINSNRWESLKGEYFIDEKVGFFITGGYVAFFLSYTVDGCMPVRTWSPSTYTMDLLTLPGS
jgi:hypothetical protein